MTTLYFGEHWGAPALVGARQIATPVGEKCWYCETVIEQGHSGFYEVGIRPMAYGLKVSVEPIYIHKECRLRSVVGGLHDVMGHCQYPGHCHKLLEADGLSVRDDALLVWDWVREHGLANGG